MAKINNNRCRRATPEQFEAIFDFMSNNLSLVTGKLSHRLSQRKKEGLWEELAFKLNNEIFGPTKTIHQWRRAWIDLKHEVREKILEQEHKVKEGIKVDVLNPYYKKVANLLYKAIAAEKQIVNETDRVIEKTYGGLVQAEKEETESRRKLDVKDETGKHHLGKKQDNTQSPFVVSIVASSKEQDQVKSEWSDENNSSASEGFTVHPQTEENPAPFVDFSTMPLFDKLEPKKKKKSHRKKGVDDDHLTNLVQIESEKADMLQVIGTALSEANNIKERRLKVEEERNRLLEERNVLENERNEMLKLLLEHLLSK